jgi:hypothetical protein
MRAPRSLRHQVATTTALVARGYDTIVGYRVEADAAIAPPHGAVRYVDAG